MPESVEQCVRSVIDEESVSESSAYAICWSRYNAGELKEDEDFEFGPQTEEEDEESDDWSEEEKSRYHLRQIAGGLYEKHDTLDKESSWSIGFATLAAKNAGMEDPLGVKAVAYKTVTGDWPSIHPSEKSREGRNHLMETYKYVVDKILGGGEVAKTLSKSNTMEKINFTADFAGTQTVFKAGDDFVIWGPASVELVDKEGDRIHADALKEALPQLLKRGRLSLEHSDQLVGEIIESYELEQEVELEIDGETFTRKEFPTDVLELDNQKPALYVCGKIYQDSRQAKRVRESIEDGELNSYSISGEALVSRSKIENGEPVNDIVEIDLSAVTVCEEGMNQGAKFATVAKENGDEASEPNVLTIKSDSGHVAVAKSDDAGSNNNPAEHPGDRTLTIQRSEENMSEETEKSEDNPQEITLNELKTEFQSVVKDALTEEDFAKETDVLGKEEVENIVEELVQEKMDEFESASEEDVEKEDAESDDVDKADPLTEEDVRGIAQDVAKDAASEAAEEVLETVKQEAEDDEDEEEDEKANEPPFDEEEEDEEEKQSGMSEEDLAAALADLAGVEPEDASEAIDALQSKENGEEEDEEDEEDEKANDESESEEDEEEDEKANEDEEEEEEAEADKGGSQYTVQELKEKLPEDVFDAVRGYIGEEKAKQAEKSDGQHPDFEFDLNDAVEKAIDDKLGTAGTPDTPAGSTEKSYDNDEEGETVGNPALAIWSDN